MPFSFLTFRSLLVFDREEQQFFHFDSLNGSNTPHAESFALKLSTAIFSRLLAVHRVSCSQQENTFDCGVYLIAFMESICMSFKNIQPWNITNPLVQSFISRQTSLNAISGYRSKISNWIQRSQSLSSR